ncbi:MAG TPA: DUF6272 family protein [Bacteroidales bacterium]|nr:DUF6272 family protein [Bacteroidales bacterium]
MIKSLDKSVIEIVLNKRDDFDNFRYKLEIAFSQICNKTKKKLLIIATELIQNNIIHNNSNPCKLKIFNKDRFLILEMAQTTDKNKIEIIKKIINSINCLDENSLKEKYRNNIINCQGNNVGNGLILCRLKSENPIMLSFKRCTDADRYQLRITIKITNYDK